MGWDCLSVPVLSNERPGFKDATAWCPFFKSLLPQMARWQCMGFCCKNASNDLIEVLCVDFFVPISSHPKKNIIHGLGGHHLLVFIAVCLLHDTIAGTRHLFPSETFCLQFYGRRESVNRFIVLMSVLCGTLNFMSCTQFIKLLFLLKWPMSLLLVLKRWHR